MVLLHGQPRFSGDSHETRQPKKLLDQAETSDGGLEDAAQFTVLGAADDRRRPLA